MITTYQELSDVCHLRDTHADRVNLAVREIDRYVNQPHVDTSNLIDSAKSSTELVKRIDAEIDEFMKGVNHGS